MSKITAIITLKNREEERVLNCLKSLRNQNLTCRIIVVDYGSTEQNLKWEKKVIPDAITKLIIVHNAGVFNKSHAINIGIKHSDTEYLLMTDIDCIFSQNFTEVVVEELEKGKNIVLCQKIDLDENFNVIGFHEPSAVGSCIGIDKNWLIKVHGFDETYTLWGREDNDLVDRAVQDGYKIVWITDKVKLFHQWHPPAPNDTLEKNARYYDIKNKPLVRNPNGWGMWNDLTIL